MTNKSAVKGRSDSAAIYLIFTSLTDFSGIPFNLKQFMSRIRSLVPNPRCFGLQSYASFMTGRISLIYVHRVRAHVLSGK